MRLDHGLLIVACGMIAGFGFGLTAGGGSVLAVPLLVYLVNVEAHQGVCISMVTFTLLAALASVRNVHQQRVEFSTALVVAVAGIISAPGGAWLNQNISESLLLILFSLGVLLIATRMLYNKAPGPSDPGPHDRDLILAMVGVVTGLLAGLLGIGGGFVIVPSLVLFCGFKILKAIQTAFLSIALISASAAVAHFFNGQRVPVAVTSLFIIGSITGMAGGLMVSERLSPQRLQRIFALLLFAIGSAMLLHNL